MPISTLAQPDQMIKTGVRHTPKEEGDMTTNVPEPGGEGSDVFGFQFFEKDAVSIGESGDLAGEVVADGVEAGFGLTFFGRAGRFFCVGAICRDLFR